MENRKEYQVILTLQGKANFKLIWESLYETHSISSAEKKIDELYTLTLSLSRMPKRGNVEKLLNYIDKEYRYLIYSITKRKLVKILYRIEGDKVFIIDFFPCQMDALKLIRRNKGK